MEEVLITFRVMQQKNRYLHESIAHLQGNQALAMFGSILNEPRINLLEKFDSTCSKFQGFVN